MTRSLALPGPLYQSIKRLRSGGQITVVIHHHLQSEGNCEVIANGTTKPVHCRMRRLVGTKEHPQIANGNVEVIITKR